VTAERAAGGRRPLRIAIVKLSALGDVVHALPVARALRRMEPRAHLTWIVEAREHAILRDHPDLDAVVAVDTRRWRRLLRRPAGARQAGREAQEVLRRIRGAGFDAAIDLQGLVKSGVLTAATGAPLRIGFAAAECRERLNCLFTNRRVAPGAHRAHVVKQYLSLLDPLGIAPGAPEFVLPPRPKAARRMEDFLAMHGVKDTDLLVAINPGAGRADKRWPLAHFTALADRLAAECAARILLLWGPNEAPMAHAIRNGLSGPAILAPPTDLDELTALLDRATLVVAGDTGPLHLAAALGTPCLGLYGPTDAVRNGPYGPRCQGVQSPDGTMPGLGSGAVFDAACALLESLGWGA
jgi:lipopolysaccharide heptosyltransferase I